MPGHPVPGHPAPAVPPGPPPGAPPPPAAPPSRPPSAAGLFLSRTFTGDWAGALRVAVWPTALLFVLACGLGIWSHPDVDELEIGWGTRMRVALAVLLRGIGGGLSLSSGGGSLAPEGDGPDSGWGEGVTGAGVTGHITVSWIPLLATAVWLAALILAAGRARRRLAGAPATAGPEAALRIGLLCAVGAFALALYAQPSYEGAELDSSPGLTLLWAFLLGTVTAGLVLSRGALDAYLAARRSPGPRIALGALRTALLALVLVLALASVVTWLVAVVTEEDADGGLLAASLGLLPNLGALGLAFAWGAPLEGRWSSTVGGGTGHHSAGYGELLDAHGAWAVVGTLAGGLVCALILGLLTARRAADQRERLLTGAFFVGAVLLLVQLAGLGFTMDFVRGDGGGSAGGYGDTGGTESVRASFELAAGGAELLLFALLWSFGGVLLAPYLLAPFRGRRTPPAPDPYAVPYSGGPNVGPYTGGPYPGPYSGSPYSAPAGGPYPAPYGDGHGYGRGQGQSQGQGHSQGQEQGHRQGHGQGQGPGPDATPGPGDGGVPPPR